MHITPPTALPPLLLEDPEMLRAVDRHDFGTVFRLARTRAGISYSKIAAACDIKPERIGTLARGQGSVTTFEKVVRISDALRIPGRLLGLADRPWESPDPSPTLHRRQVLRAGLAASVTTAAPSVPTGRIGAHHVARLSARTTRLRALDEVLGGGDTYRMYAAEYQDTKRLLRDNTYDGATGRALLALLAEQAQQAGWAAFDAGRETDAVSLYESSRAAAMDAGDEALAGNALAVLAYQRLGQDRRAGAEIATRSMEGISDRTPNTVVALLHERRAWACAVAGMPGDTERSLAAAAEAVDTPAGEPGPGWAAWVDRTEVDIMTGRCWAELRRPLRAVPILEAALARYDDRHARDKALYSSWLAQAYLAAGEAEQSAAIVSRALVLADGVASVRPRRRLAPVLEELGAYRDVPAVADFLNQVRAS